MSDTVALCPNCFDELSVAVNKDNKIQMFCNNCFKTVSNPIRVDEIVAPTISLLNKNNFKTYFSCEGHYSKNGIIMPYITFEKNERNKALVNYIKEKVSAAKSNINSNENEEETIKSNCCSEYIPNFGVMIYETTPDTDKKEQIGVAFIPMFIATVYVREMASSKDKIKILKSKMSTNAYTLLKPKFEKRAVKNYINKTNAKIEELMQEIPDLNLELATEMYLKYNSYISGISVNIKKTVILLAANKSGFNLLDNIVWKHALFLMTKWKIFTWNYVHRLIAEYISRLRS